jgi:hypothetical protein
MQIKYRVYFPRNFAQRYQNIDRGFWPWMRFCDRSGRRRWKYFSSDDAGSVNWETPPIKHRLRESWEAVKGRVLRLKTDSASGQGIERRDVRAFKFKAAQQCNRTQLISAIGGAYSQEPGRLCPGFHARKRVEAHAAGRGRSLQKIESANLNQFKALPTELLEQ